MIPAVLPAEVRADPKRSGEVAVYDHLSGSPYLDGSTIFYSCEWLGPYGNMLRDGEADFVVAHPKIGYLVLEVKGGRVRRSVADGKWTTIDRNGKSATIENPVRQAMKSKKVILAALAKNWPGKVPWITARHGVVLPHSSRPTNAAVMGSAAPIEIFAFKEDMATLGARVLQMMLWTPDGAQETPGGLGPTGILLLEDFYGRDLDFAPRLASEIKESEAAITSLTATQTRYLNFLAGTRTAIIEGGAGTGKTVLAVERARRSAAAGRRVLLLCFNRPLSVAISNELKGSAAAVATFHEFCSRMCVTTGVDLDGVKASVNDRVFWTVKLPELLTDIGLTEPPERYDDLIIDEGQDFKGNWLEALKLFLNEDASLFLFRDDFQNIYGGAEAVAVIGSTPLQLTENIRNTQTIFTAGSRFRTGSEQTCLGPPGGPVHWVTCSPERVARTAERELSRLLTVENIAPDDIALLCGCAAEASVLRAAPTIAGRPWCAADQPTPGAVTVDSVMRFKGLDKPVVIVCEADDACDELAYVAMTRAKSHLIVIASEAAADRLGRA
ncbi:AAA family ATPase [Sphingomonas sp. CJ99]